MLPFEENIDLAHQCKLENYEDLWEQCVQNSWTTDIFTVEIRCRGFIANLTSGYLTKFSLLPAKYIKIFAGIIQPIAGGDKKVHSFSKGISPKMNVIVQLEFEFAYYDVTV